MIFYLLSFLGLTTCCFIVKFLLDNNQTINKEEIDLGCIKDKLSSVYKTLYKNYYILFIGISGSACYSITIIFNAISPYLLQIKFGLSAIGFGSIGFLLSISYLMGSLLVYNAINKIGIKNFIFIGYIVVVLAGLFMFFSGFYASYIKVILAGMMIFTFGQAMIFPNLITLALEKYKNASGTIVAFLSFMQQAIGALFTLSSSLLIHVSQLTLAIDMLLISVFGLIVYYLAIYFWQ